MRYRLPSMPKVWYVPEKVTSGVLDLAKILPTKVSWCVGRTDGREFAAIGAASCGFFRRFSKLEFTLSFQVKLVIFAYVDEILKVIHSIEKSFKPTIFKVYVNLLCDHLIDYHILDKNLIFNVLFFGLIRIVKITFLAKFKFSKITFTAYTFSKSQFSPKSQM